MKGVADAVDRLLSHLGTLLRYVAPGFAALCIAAALNDDARRFILSQRTPTPVLVLGMVLGFTIYSIHTGLLQRWFWYWITLARRLRNHRGDEWKVNDKERWLITRVWHEMIDLDEQRWLRRANSKKDGKPEEPLATVQAEMDKWASMLNYLYCLFYSMVSIPVLEILRSEELSKRCIICLLSSGLVFVVVFVSEYRITGREIDLRNKYPQ